MLADFPRKDKGPGPRGPDPVSERLGSGGRGLLLILVDDLEVAVDHLAVLGLLLAFGRGARAGAGGAAVGLGLLGGVGVDRLRGLAERGEDGLAGLFELLRGGAFLLQELLAFLEGGLGAGLGVAGELVAVLLQLLLALEDHGVELVAGLDELAG